MVDLKAIRMQTQSDYDVGLRSATNISPQAVLLMVAVCEAAQRLEAKYYSGNPPHDPGCPECDVRRAVRALGEKHEPR